MSENAIGYLLNRAAYHGHHVPHRFRAAFSTIMNERAERNGDPHDRKVIDPMFADDRGLAVEVRHGNAVRTLLQDECLLGVRKPQCPHRSQGDYDQKL